MNDFVTNFSEVYLRYLNNGAMPLTNDKDNYTINSSNLIRKSRADMNVLKVITVMKKENRWPIKCFRLKKFHETESLNTLRLHTSHAIFHRPVAIDNNTKENRSKCALCSGGRVKRNANLKCSICNVPLCTSVFKYDKSSMVPCFVRCHSCSDLLHTSQRCQKVLIKYYDSNKTKRDGGVIICPTQLAVKKVNKKKTITVNLLTA